MGFVEQIGLNDERRSLLAEMAGERHGHKIATPYGRQPSVSWGLQLLHDRLLSRVSGDEQRLPATFLGESG